MMRFCCRFCGDCGGDHYLTVFQLAKSNLDDLDIPSSRLVFSGVICTLFELSVLTEKVRIYSLPFFEFLSY